MYFNWKLVPAYIHHDSNYKFSQKKGIFKTLVQRAERVFEPEHFSEKGPKNGVISNENANGKIGRVIETRHRNDSEVYQIKSFAHIHPN